MFAVWNRKMNILISVALLAFAGFIQEGDAEITEWTTPAIASAANGTGTLTVSESQALNTDITTYVAVTDASTVTYELESDVAPFALSTAGVLTITAILDADTPANYTLMIVATDDGNATGTADISVTVNDIDDAPTFGANSYSQCMADGSVGDTTVITVLATDADPGDTITYTINSGDDNSDFAIDNTTGAITVNTNTTLSTTTASYTLVINATDDESTPQIGMTTVTVTVSTNCNSATALGISITAILMIMLVSML